MSALPIAISKAEPRIRFRLFVRAIQVFQDWFTVLFSCLRDFQGFEAWVAWALWLWCVGCRASWFRAWSCRAGGRKFRFRGFGLSSKAPARKR